MVIDLQHVTRTFIFIYLISMRLESIAFLGIAGSDAILSPVNHKESLIICLLGKLVHQIPDSDDIFFSSHYVKSWDIAAVGLSASLSFMQDLPLGTAAFVSGLFSSPRIQLL